MNDGVKLAGVAIASTVAIAAVVNPAGGVKIDYEAVEWIESRGNPSARGSAGEIGLFQITPVVLRGYNARHDRQFSREDLFDPEVNQRVAVWYLSDRIPEMLDYFGLAVSAYNILWAYNAGISRVKNSIMPEQTKEYLSLYEKYSEVQL